MKIRATAIAAVLLFALTGCGEAVDATPSASADASASAEKAAPLVAETTAAEETDSPEVAFLEQVCDRLPSNSQIPNATDAQLVTAEQEACQRIAAGEDTMVMSFIDGEEIGPKGYYEDSGAIITSARLAFCPELD